MKVTKTGIAKHISDALADHEPPMTIKDLVDKTGIGESKLKRIVSGKPDENGNKRLPNSDEIIDIANALDISVYKLLTGNDDENHVVCDELGLTNNTINTLKEWKKLDPSGAGKTYAQGVIDVLVANPYMLYAIGQYLSMDYSHINFFDYSEKKHSVLLTLSDNTTITPDDYERMARLRLLDGLKQLRDDMKGAVSNETGKR